MVKAAEQAVCIRGQVEADDVGLLVRDMVKEAGVLMREAVVILLPYVRCEHVVERRDLLAPRQLVADLEPLCMLGEHGVDDADEGLVAVEEAVAAGQQVALEQTLADVLGEHRVHDSAVGGEMVVGVVGFAVPRSVGLLKDRGETVGGRFIRTEGAEAALLFVELVDIAHESAEHGHILRLDCAGVADVHAVFAEVRHAQILQQQAAVGVRVRTHAARALRREVEQLLHGDAVFIEQLFGAVGLQPLFDLADMLGGVGLDGHLMCAPVVLDLETVDICRTCPALGAAQDDHRPARADGAAVLACVFLESEDLLDALIERVGHEAMHDGGVLTLDEVRLPAAAAEEVLQLLMGDAGEERRVRDLIAVEVQDREHCAVGLGVDELVEVP